ncbi:hypothetical protein RJ639_041588 [Escallonia herrerae]|uniref:Reverse transcriptase Ty1/copia-type domain-containing protein n=1 Tax=Escallonia herrerae TaxID=1293975 RepID=A0AA89B7G5_9ASTE|nr:hypothetical protein RJ639_041588 [Escallonia herrerae]
MDKGRSIPCHAFPLRSLKYKVFKDKLQHGQLAAFRNNWYQSLGSGFTHVGFTFEWEQWLKKWWKMQFEDYLYQKDLYLPLVREKPEVMNASEWAILDRKALATMIYMLVAGSSMRRINELKKKLASTFSMKDLGEAKQLLGMRITRDRKQKKLRLSQEKFDKSAIHLAKNSAFHSRTKHIQLMYHFIRSLLEDGQLNLEKIEGNKNPTDMLTNVIDRKS